jgi:hypothetical protein
LKFKLFKLISVALASFLMISGCFANEPMAADFEKAFTDKMMKSNNKTSLQMIDSMDIKVVIRNQSKSVINSIHYYSSYITMTLEPKVDFYRFVKLDTNGKSLIRKVDNTGASMILKGVSTSKFVNDRWVPEINGLTLADSRKVDGFPITNWKSPVIIL